MSFGSHSAVQSPSVLKSQLTSVIGATLLGFKANESGSVHQTIFDKVSNVLGAQDFGVVGGGIVDDSDALIDFFTAGMTTGKKMLINAGTYKVTKQIISTVSLVTLNIEAVGGLAIFEYSGTEIGNLIQATNCDHAYVKGLRFSCNNLIATPIDIRRLTASVGGVATIEGVEAYDCKQVGAVTTNPTGILVGGSFSYIIVDGCLVDNVTHTDIARSSTGIAVIDVEGTAQVTNNTVGGILTPSTIDADGIKVFGKDSGTITTELKGVAAVYGNKITDCEGRFIKVQLSNIEIHGNKLKLSDSFSTITEWRAFDIQSNNGNIHDNTLKFGALITWGANATIFTLQNIRDDSFNKTSFAVNNRITTKTAGISLLASLLAEHGKNTFVVEGNEVLGETIKRGFQIRVTGGATGADLTRVYYRNNTVEDYSSQDMFNPYDQVDFAEKMYLELVDNRVINRASVSRTHGSLSGFQLDQFKIANNVNSSNRIDWPFDMDDLPGGNAFTVGSQTITNKGAGMTTYFHVITDNFVQRNLSTNCATEVKRGSLDGTTWYAWV